MTKPKTAPRARYTLEFKQEAVRQAKDKTISWLLWYNQARLHSTLGYVSPMQSVCSGSRNGDVGT